jgi:hypothetical protein
MTVFKIYYMHPGHFRAGICGDGTTDLAATHIHLKDLTLPDGAGLDDVYREMQGEVWSPEGEAFDLIEEKGLQHTSMSVGDVVIHDGQPYIVARYGFDRLPKEVMRNLA